MSGRGPESVEVSPAASVVLLRDGDSGLEILYLRRSLSLAFHPGSWVFPGGRVDSEDWTRGDDEEVAARNACAREALEEAALDLDASALEHACHWTTPVGPPRRFATWFFVAEAPPGDVEVDGGEIIDSMWLSPRDVLERRHQGHMTLAIPTFVLTTRLMRHATARSAMAAVREWPKDVLVPRLCRVDGGRVALYEPDAGYAHTDPSAPGARHRMVMLESGWSYERRF